MTEMIQCPTCPICGGAPVLPMPFLTPWFCGAPSCITFAWDPYSSLEENLMDAAPLRQTPVEDLPLSHPVFDPLFRDPDE
jgi:hypothetical protein